MVTDHLCRLLQESLAPEVVEAGEDEVADGVEVSIRIVQFEVKEDGFSVDEAGWTSEHGGVSRDIWVVRVNIVKRHVTAVAIRQIQFTQAHSKIKELKACIQLLYLAPHPV